jgi:outer membrane lipoprotein-sorting protein
MTTELTEHDLERMLKEAANTFEPPPGIQDEIGRALLGETPTTGGGRLGGTTSVAGVVKPARPRIRLLKPALAAAIILAAVVGAGLYWLSGAKSVAFADVVRALVDTRTATFKMTTSNKVGGRELPPQHADGIYMDPGFLRMTSQEGIVILDAHEGKMTIILPALKRVTLITARNMPKESQEAWNPFERARLRLQSIESDKDQNVTELGQKQINGRKAVGYRVTKPADDIVITIWADVETKLPVILEVTTGSITNEMSDIVLGASVDEKLFSPEIPKDYAVQEIVNDMSPPTEADLIEMFRIWTSHMDNVFPLNLKQSVVEKFVEQQCKVAEASGKQPTPDDVFALQGLIMKMSRGGMFVANLPATSDKHYAGKGVKLNTPDTPVFWYRPENSKTWRVIYADLSTKEVQEMPAAPPATAPASSEAEQTLDKAIGMGANVPEDKRGLVLRMLSLNESDLIKGLRLFATLSHGQYPSSLDGKTVVKEAEAWARKSPEVTKAKRDSPDLIFCAAFYDKLTRENKDVKYYGDRVSQQNAGLVLLRWKLHNGRYRVIYGNLTTDEVDPSRWAQLEQALQELTAPASR